MSVTDLIIDPFNSGRARNLVVTHSFMIDPVGTLRQHGANVPAESEAAWRQLTAALLALRAANTGKGGGTSPGTHALYVDIYIPA
jgi:hypothetical protein